MLVYAYQRMVSLSVASCLRSPLPLIPTDRTWKDPRYPRLLPPRRPRPRHPVPLLPLCRNHRHASFAVPCACCCFPCGAHRPSSFSAGALPSGQFAVPSASISISYDVQTRRTRHRTPLDPCTPLHHDRCSLRRNLHRAPNARKRDKSIICCRRMRPSPDLPVRSSTSQNRGALQMLHVWRRAQFTLAHLLHCQSSALNKPRDFSAAAFPISVPVFFLPPLPPPSESLAADPCFDEPLLGRSLPHRLHWLRRAKFRFLQLLPAGTATINRAALDDDFEG